MAEAQLLVADVTKRLQSWFPLELAEEWDNVGLLLGHPLWPVRRVLVCLTLTTDVATAAADSKTDLVIAHHPILFRPIQRLRGDDPLTAPVLTLAEHRVALYSPHTAFDSARAGINQAIAEALELREIRPLRPAAGPQQYKLVVFVPQQDLQRVLDALFEAGAGVIGEYRECSFRLAGKGTFYGTESTSPTVGQKGRREEVEEWRVEVVCPAGAVDEIVRAMRAAHSYEEPAYDVYPLRRMPEYQAGGGRMGRLEEPLALDVFARRCGRLFDCSAVAVVGTGTRPIGSVAIACGAGASFLQDASAQGADVLLTGEARFHQQLEARERGLGLVLVGHFEMERFGVARLAERLSEAFPQLEIELADESPPARFVAL